jgi:hypothetical protein
LQSWLDKQNINLTSTLHTAKTESKNQKDENMKPEITDYDNTYARQE